MTVSKRRGAIYEGNRSHCLLYPQNKVLLRKSLLSVTHNVSVQIEFDWCKWLTEQIGWMRFRHWKTRTLVLQIISQKNSEWLVEIGRTGLTKGNTKRGYSFSVRNGWRKKETYRASGLYPHRAGMQQLRIKLKPRTIGRIRSCWKTHTCVWGGQLMCQCQSTSVLHLLF